MSNVDVTIARQQYNQTDDTCVICFAQMTEETSSALKCGHKFHGSCILKSFEIWGDKCPCCRRKHCKEEEKEEEDSGSDSDSDSDSDSMDERDSIDESEDEFCTALTEYHEACKYD